MSPSPPRIGSIAPLYVPGDRPERFDKALHSDADAVIIDLEDAVAPERKAAARAAARDYLRTRPRDPRGKPVYLRVNAAESPWFGEDMAALHACPGLTGLRVPKIESAADVATVVAALREPWWPDDATRSSRWPELHCLIESARGVEAAYAIATAHPLVAGIGLGEADLASELGITDEAGLAWARGRVVMAARAAGLPPPLMSVYASVSDLAGLAASCAVGRSLGFVGRSLIHPRQALPVLRAFAPSAAAADAARAVLDALVGGTERKAAVAVLPDGRFVDRAMVEAARRTVALRAVLARYDP